MKRSIDRISLAIFFVLVTTSSVGAVRTSSVVHSPTTFTKVISLAAASKDHDLLKDPQNASVSRQSGTTYVADAGHHQIRAVLASGEVRLVAGSGSPGFVDGVATSARFKAPQALIVDPVRSVIYVADTGNNVIRSIGQDGVVRTFAGSGRPDDRDGTAAEAGFKSPAGLALDVAGNVYVADSGNDKIRRITPAGVVTTVAGAALLKNPRGIVVDDDGVIYVADTANHIIRKIANGIVSTLAGTGHPGYVNGAALLAEFKEPSSLAIDDDGSLLVADTKNHVIRRIGVVGSDVTVGTIAGNGHPGFIDGDVALAQFNEPAGISVEGAIYVADAKNDAIRLILPNVSATAIDPRSGPASGGTRVRILGAGFVPGLTTVSFGGIPATAVSFMTSTELEALTPSGVAGFADVRVSTPAGTGTLANAFRYVEPPTIASLAPARGAVAGGRTITISGANFIDGETSVFFGGAVATLVHVANSTTFTAVTPAHMAGVVDVSVTTPGGTATLLTAFRYLDPPVMTSFTPQQGRTGTTLTISGQNFDSDPSGNIVSIGGALAPIVSTSPTLLVITVPSGAVTGKVTVTTEGGSVTSGANFVVLTYTSIAVSPAVTTIDVGETVQLTASGTLPNGTTEPLTSDVTWTSADPTIANVDAGVVHALSGGTTTITATYHGLSASASVTSRAGVPLPPDPSTIATPPDPTAVSSLLDEVRFLYTGPNAIQTGVAPETIQERRAAVLRGRVLKRNGLAQSGVTVTVLGHPEYGQALSRADGYYDLVVNGGGPLVLRFERTGAIPAQRRVLSQWTQQTRVDDVVLIEYDEAMTTVSMQSSVIQVARGSISADVDGTRRATLMFPAATTASLVLPDGSLQAVSSLSIRATEFTVGARGRLSMPADLPPTSGYTYCVELSADEAVAAGANEVRFSKPVSMYVENFIGFPVGGIVPVGYYDRVRGAWMSSTNGRVVKILAIVAGAAQIDADGNGIAESSPQLATLGINTAELQKLATLYAAGQTLWRVPIQHFSPWDSNWPYAPPADAAAPRLPGPDWARNAEQSCQVPFRSTVDCHNRTLGEEVPIAGTPFSLLYDSSRVARSQYRLDVNVTGTALPASLETVELRVTIAGRVFEWQFAPQPNLKQTFVWDGLDVYGRRVTGVRDARIDLGYVYHGVYTQPGNYERAWASVSGAPLTASRNDLRFVTHQNWSVPLGHFDVAPTGFGGWTFSHQRLYDGRGRVLYDGAANRSADPQGTGRTTVRVVAGSGNDFFGNEIPATAARIAPSSVASTSDGGFYVAERALVFPVVRFVDANGVIRTVMGEPPTGSGADGSDALHSPGSPDAIAVGPDDTLYIADHTNTFRVRKIVNGIITTVAGTGQSPTNALEPVDGKLATSVAIFPIDIAVAPDGTLYINEGRRSIIVAVGADGIMRKVAGVEGAFGSGPDDRPAINTAITAGYLTVDADGNLYFGEGVSGAKPFIRKVGVDGIIRGFAGQAPPGITQPIADGADAKSGWLQGVGGLTVTPDGSVVVTENEFANRRVRSIASDGIVTTLVGTGAFSATPPVNGTYARLTLLGSNTTEPSMVRYVPDGSLLVSTTIGNATILKTEPLFPPTRAGDTIVPSEDGSRAYIFAAGKHLRSVDTHTGATLLSFTYDGHGYLAAVTDANGEITRIERNPAGDPIAIIAPGGQRTVIDLQGGLLASVQNPAGEGYQFTYHESLLASRRDPRGGLTQFTYDANGRLVRDADAAGGFISLVHTGGSDNFSVDRVSAEGLTTHLSLMIRPDRVSERTTTDATGLLTRSSLSDGLTVTQLPDGTVITQAEAADSRFGSTAPLTSVSTRLPSGRVRSLQHSRAIVLADPQDPLSLLNITDSWTVNGRTSTSQYEASTRRSTTRTPSGRTATFQFDALGRLVLSERPGLAPSTITYNSKGLVESISAGTRNFTFTYNGRSELIGIRDPLSRTVGLVYDLAGRVTRQTRPDGAAVDFEYDSNGNLVSLTPPSRNAHRFDYTAVDLNETYSPPTLSNDGMTTYRFDKDRRPTTIKYADGDMVSIIYDSGGRTSTISVPDGVYMLEYGAYGALASIQTPDAEVLQYTYDGPLLTQTTWSGIVAGAVSHSYDDDFRLLTENDVSFSYDGDDLLTKVGAMTLARDPQTGLLVGSSLSNLNDSYTYNQYGEIIQYHAVRNGSQLISFDYTRDAAGRVTAETQQIAGVATTRGFEYDTLGQLIRVTRGGVVVAEYDYDANGNRIAHRYLGGSSAATYDAQDRLSTYDDTTYTYSAKGDLRTATTGGHTTTFGYDVFGNLRIVSSDGRLIEYVVDGQNRRIGKKIDGVLINGWLYGDQLRIVAELSGSGAVSTRYVYGTRQNVPDYMVRDGITYRLLLDRRGSPTLVINTTTGEIAQQLAYDEFGRVTFDSHPGFQPFGFAGGLYDPDTGFVRFGSRDYDGRTGRWTAKDPIGFAGGDTGLYTYVGNDPINFVDPTGTDQLTADPHVQEIILDLWKKAAWGLKPQEQGAWIMRDPATGKYSCKAWPQTNESNALTLKKGTLIPRNTVAVMHTHPSVGNRTQQYDDAGDRKVATVLSMPIYTITKTNGVGKYDPATKTASQEESSLNFPNIATDKCACQK